MSLVDAHAHVQLARFGDPALRMARLRRARRAGVIGILVPAVGPETWADTLAICDAGSEEEPARWCALGVHPYALRNSSKASDDTQTIGQLDRLLSENQPHVVAVGECGLDYRAGDRTRQHDVLIQQLELARRHALPCVLHCVRAHHDLLALLKNSRTSSSMIHSFNSSPQDAMAYVRQGHFISFSATVCDPRNSRVRAAASAVPIQSLLVETDSPDQTARARRPAVNEPAFIGDVVDSIAQLRGANPEVIAQRSVANAFRFMRREPPP